MNVSEGSSTPVQIVDGDEHRLHLRGAHDQGEQGVEESSWLATPKPKLRSSSDPAARILGCPWGEALRAAASFSQGH